MLRAGEGLRAATVRLGVRYSPELDRETDAAGDAKLMKRAGLNAACVGPQMWDRIEPGQGRYEFDWLDGIVDALAEQKIAVFLCLPILSPPLWAFSKYNDLGITNAAGQTARGGGSLCYSAPNLTSLSEGLTRALAEQYADHDAVAGWRIEAPPGEFTPRSCYCKHCENTFRDWLIRRYDTEEALSESWSVRYRAWSEVRLPRNEPGAHPSHALDAERFRHRTRRTFYESLIDNLKDAGGNREITIDHELIGNADSTNASLSFAAQTDPRRSQWLDTSLGAETVRPMTARFSIVEKAGGMQRANPSAGGVRRWIWQSVANGADRAYAGCWRTPQSGHEMGAHGLLSTDGRPTTPYKEVRRTAEELNKILPKLKGTKVEPKVALLTSLDHRLVAGCPAAMPDLDGPAASRAWYAAIKRTGQNCDIVSPGQPLESYRFVMAPWLPIIDEDLAEQLEGYVKGGGRVAFGPGSGSRTIQNTLRDVTPPGLLLPIVGATVDEVVVTSTEEPMRVNFPRGALIAQRIQVSGRIEVLDRMTAEAVCEYVDGRFAGKAAITRYQLGKGQAYYIGAPLPPETLDAFLDEIAPDFPMKNLPEGVEVTQRKGSDRRIVFVFNHTAQRQTITLPKAMPDLLSGDKVGPEVKLSANGVLILRS